MWGHLATSPHVPCREHVKDGALRVCQGKVLFTGARAKVLEELLMGGTEGALLNIITGQIPSCHRTGNGGRLSPSARCGYHHSELRITGMKLEGTSGDPTEPWIRDEDQLGWAALPKLQGAWEVGPNLESIGINTGHYTPASLRVYYS